ncbi:MAG: hypothetical protein HN522_04190 [Flavobacteriales bacterium]|jgi:hypothetical protein|nr:hypothetical protein [Flavobacteriales bacterium]MBT6169800.1 hypothetical protein [Flavobacteriaceae bacterium]
MRNLIIIFLLCIESVLAQNVKENIFGFATSNTFTYCDVTDTSFLNKAIAIKPKLLRFPGGAVGNFYHYGEKGYGFDFSEIDQYHDGKMPKRARGLDNSRIKKNQQQDYIEDFIILAKKTNAKAIIVANLFIDNDDILLMIKKLIENNIEVVGVELGSELSNRSYFTKGYTIDEYVIAAKKCSDKINEKYPNLKTAIVAAPLVNKKNHRHSVWNDKLAKLNFYDAIIIHSYAKVTKGNDRYGQMISEENEGDNKTEAFEIYKNRAIDYLINQYPKEVNAYEGIFNKPIWVTEWNLQISKTTGNTLLQSLFVAQYFLELLSNPDLSVIELATYHNLGGRDYGGSVFRNNKEVIEIQSTYYPLTMLGKIFDYDIVRIEKKQHGEIFTYNCFDEYNKLIISYDIDWNSNDFKYKLEKSGDKYFSQIYGSNNLFDIPNLKGVIGIESGLKIKY